MKVKYGKQININEVLEADIDILLFANNVEKRKLVAYHRLKSEKKIGTAIALHYPNSNVDDISDVKNIIINHHESLLEILEEVILSTKKRYVTLFIDYSCMTKSWYYSILLFLSNKSLGLDQVKCYFSYTPSLYSKPMIPKPNTDIQPLPGKYIIPNNKPKALIVCLGYEQNKAQGIIDQLDPKITYVFYSKPALDPKFIKTIEKNNRTVLEDIYQNRPENIIEFPFDNLLFIERELTALYYMLKDDYNIIIAPLGPKPFTFVSMMMSIVYKDIDIWRVGSGFDINEYERQPFDEEKFIISEILFEQ